MIVLKQVNKAFAPKDILHDFSLPLPEGRTTCLLGPSGCGKTTLLRVAAGLLSPDSGTVEGLPGRISTVFQEDRLLPWFDAMENITATGASVQQAQKALDAMLLSGDAHTMPSDLSGGMQRRLAIARALAYDGDAYFLDEPLRGLDNATAVPVLAAIKAALAGKTALLITHSPEEAYALADKLFLVDGPPVRIVQEANQRDFESVEALNQWLQKSSPSSTTLAT